MSPTVELPRLLPLFTALTSDELGKIAELCETNGSESEEYIFRESEPGNRSTNESLKSFLTLSMW